MQFLAQSDPTAGNHKLVANTSTPLTSKIMQRPPVKPL
jgi:hypothetical protein